VRSRQGTAVAIPSSPRCAAVTVRHARFSTRSRQLCDEAATGGTGPRRTRKRAIIFGRRARSPGRATEIRRPPIFDAEPYGRLTMPSPSGCRSRGSRRSLEKFGQAPSHPGNAGSGAHPVCPLSHGVVAAWRPVIAELSILDTLAIDCRVGVGTISANGRCNSANLQRDAKGWALVLVRAGAGNLDRTISGVSA
jgi:hypothetical protein